MIAFQQQVKNNSVDLSAMVTDLSDWSEQITAKEKNIRRGGAASQAKSDSSRGGQAKPLPPIRNRIDINESLKKSKKEAPAGSKPATQKLVDAQSEGFREKVKRDTTPMPDYYKAWDKIAAENDSSDDDGDTGDACCAKNPKFKEEDKTTAEMFKPTSGAKPNTTIVVKGARQSQLSFAEESKLQGNAYFVSLDYAKAIECYTRCLNNIDNAKDAHLITDPNEMKKLVLSNRS